MARSQIACALFWIGWGAGPGTLLACAGRGFASRAGWVDPPPHTLGLDLMLILLQGVSLSLVNAASAVAPALERAAEARLYVLYCGTGCTLLMCASCFNDWPQRVLCYTMLFLAVWMPVVAIERRLVPKRAA